MPPRSRSRTHLGSARRPTSPGNVVGFGAGRWGLRPSWWAGLALVLVAAVGCGDPNGMRDVAVDRPAAPLVPARCPTDRAGMELGDGSSGPVVPSGAVPAGFAPASVMLCRLVDVPTTDPTYVGSAITTDEGPADADLLAALGLPDQTFRHPGRGACTLELTALPHLLLLDQDRRAVRATVPVDGCARIRPEVARAVAAIALTETSRRVLDRS